MNTSQRKSIFISGGASGIGREVTLRFHAEGWIVGVYDIDATALEKLSRDYPDIIIGELDAIDQSPEIIKKQCDINCTGVMYGARATHPYLSRTPGAHLVNMGSAAALYGQPHIAPYSASGLDLTLRYLIRLVPSFVTRNVNKFVAG
ncbi:SDR family NAD(P)-dependent oxidoreductase [Corynebacterium sp. MC-04]|uniref:SDR family NAD(P)-dependent oxidoreductase n=1 Tax=Corynebacterium parakroppenstedtii TaxID=2828363 RepID=A0ABS9HNQ1_9CORY|nr:MULTISPECIES: SDR family NAD(P)-dependent oxidoreductase [Corynebacterium]KXB49904.1 oxidoreductase, short chain dehydrogenase/reductase family protein [Corynebacterium kroppenstedtii]MBY0793646.1 SDR family NAD(P)-dependent oxidoreductase [Corynebacterium parakroppenstedtii]MBY0797106.1 SDR family NAD(P)-dependent oxidoreductase [Corynebacterium parakroppenstedtii]MCF6770490.1 SDR family NAD(P)-dependent oxidoreductase [Corynebacterium parakroppenstedtii]MCF6772609.1 SDR family NAD(P)-depe